MEKEVRRKYDNSDCYDWKYIYERIKRNEQYITRNKVIEENRYVKL